MALALAEMPATGTYDFGWITAHMRDSDRQASGRNGDSDGEQRVLLVDVGGGQGQILKSILEQNADIPPHRCVLEDQSAEAVSADSTGVMSAVKRQVASFFHEQPVKGTYPSPLPPDQQKQQNPTRLTQNTQAPLSTKSAAC